MQGSRLVSVPRVVMVYKPEVGSWMVALYAVWSRLYGYVSGYPTIARHVSASG